MGGAAAARGYRMPSGAAAAIRFALIFFVVLCCHAPLAAGYVKKSEKCEWNSCMVCDDCCDEFIPADECSACYAKKCANAVPVAEKKLGMEFPLACGVLILYILIGHTIAWLQAKTGWIIWMHESGIAIVLGLVIGAVLYRSDVVIPFQENIFFYFVLPYFLFYLYY